MRSDGYGLRGDGCGAFGEGDGIAARRQGRRGRRTTAQRPQYFAEGCCARAPAGQGRTVCACGRRQLSGFGCGDSGAGCRVGARFRSSRRQRDISLEETHRCDLQSGAQRGVERHSLSGRGARGDGRRETRSQRQ